MKKKNYQLLSILALLSSTATSLSVHFLAIKISKFIENKLYSTSKFILLIFSLFVIFFTLLYLKKDKLNYLLKNNGNYISEAKYNAMHPKVPNDFMSKNPIGWVLGRVNSKYFTLKYKNGENNHAILIGPSGSGKSSHLINALIYYLHSKLMTIFALDIKPELARLSTLFSNKNVKIVNPTLKSGGVGWDVYYNLDSNCDDDELIEELEPIVEAIITEDKRDDVFFVNSARNVLNGLLAYCYRKGLGFVSSIREIRIRGMTNFIADIETDVSFVNGHPKLISFIVHYGKDDRTTNSISMVLQENLGIFMRDNVLWSLQNNPNMANPNDLLDGKSIFLSIPESLIEQYKVIFRIITKQVLRRLEATSELDRSCPETKPILLLLDEYGTIGKLDIANSLATLRSRNICIWISVQGIEQLDSIYGKEVTRGILQNCATKIIFNSTNPDTNEYFSKLCSDYLEKRLTFSSGKYEGSTSETNDYRKIIDTSDFAYLQANNEIFIFTNRGFYTIERCPYFSIKEYKELSEYYVVKNDEYEKRR